MMANARPLFLALAVLAAFVGVWSVQAFTHSKRVTNGAFGRRFSYTGSGCRSSSCTVESATALYARDTSNRKTNQFRRGSKSTDRVPKRDDSKDSIGAPRDLPNKKEPSFIRSNKEDKYSIAEPEIERLVKKADRKPLSEFTEGQKLRGRVISVKEFGLFVDVGAIKDGLVHVRDISKDYFVQNHENKFIPGQDMDVWIKFVDHEVNKLGLQCFPHVERSVTRDPKKVLAAQKLEAGDSVSGQVVRVSNFGVFVDVGAEVHAFLHRRKMKISKVSSSSPSKA